MDEDRVLTFDNVRAPSLTLADLLAGRVRVLVYEGAERVPIELVLPQVDAGAAPPLL